MPFSSYIIILCLCVGLPHHVVEILKGKDWSQKIFESPVKKEKEGGI